MIDSWDWIRFGACIGGTSMPQLHARSLKLRHKCKMAASIFRIFRTLISIQCKKSDGGGLSSCSGPSTRSKHRNVYSSFCIPVSSDSGRYQNLAEEAKKKPCLDRGRKWTTSFSRFGRHRVVGLRRTSRKWRRLFHSYLQSITRGGYVGLFTATHWGEVRDGNLLFSLCDGVEQHVFHPGAGRLWLYIPAGVQRTAPPAEPFKETNIKY